MATQESANRGPIWRDVASLIDTFTARWGGVWVCSIRPNPGRSRNGHLWLLCERTHAVGRVGAIAQERAGRSFPTSDRVSMPAALCGLLYELDERLQADSRVAERQATF